MATDACQSLQALANSLNGLVDAGRITREHAHNIFAQTTADPSNPNAQPHPNPSAFIVPDPEGFMFGNLRSIAQVFEEGNTSVPWLVEGLIPMRAVTLLAAGAKVGKTTMLCSILNAMSTGADWAGLPVAKGTGWLFTQEGSHSLSEIIADVGPTLDAPHMIFPLSRKGGASFAGICDLVARTVSRIKAGIEAEQPNGWTAPKAIIFDTLGSWSGLEDINNYSEVLKAYQPLQQLRDLTGAAIIVVHHARKDTATYGGGPLQLVLGSVGFSTEPDHIIALNKWGEGRSRRLQLEGRYRQALEELVITHHESDELHRGFYTAGSEAATGRDSKAETDQRVMAMFAYGVEYAMRELLEAKPADIGEKRLRDAVKRLVESGQLASNGAPSNSPNLRYTLGTPEIARAPLI